MRKRLCAAFAIAVFLAAHTLSISGQSSTARIGWDIVKSLSSGTHVRIDLKAGGHVEGDVKEITDSEIILNEKSGMRSYVQPEIKKIYRIESSSRAKSILLGTGVGAGGGAAAGAIALGATGGSDRTSAVLGAFVLAGAGIGALVGTVVGKGSKRVLVYESK